MLKGLDDQKSDRDVKDEGCWKVTGLWRKTRQGSSQGGMVGAGSGALLCRMVREGHSEVTFEQAPEGGETGSLAEHAARGHCHEKALGQQQDCHS